MTKQERNREYYQRNRERILAQRHEYIENYVKKGLRKPRPPARGRKHRDHERYMEQREKILAKQKEYRDAHRDEINARRRQRCSEKTVERLRALYQTAK
jgi:hypothetical protein